MRGLHSEGGSLYHSMKGTYHLAVFGVLYLRIESNIKRIQGRNVSRKLAAGTEAKTRGCCTLARAHHLLSLLSLTCPPRNGTSRINL